MSISGYPPGGHERPSKNLNAPQETAAMNLRRQHILILNLMLRNRTVKGVVPRADSAEFYEYVQENGLKDVISQEQLKRALLFLEKTFENAVKERGKNPIFLDAYREERFQLSKQLWGQAEDLEEQDDLDHHHIDDLNVVVDAEQDAMDIAILRIMLQFKLKNSRENPEPDSDDLYKSIIESIKTDIQQDELVDRILILEENYNRIAIEKIMGEHVDFAAPSRGEIHSLSKAIWQNRDQFIDAGNILDKLENLCGGGDENRGDDEEDDQGGAQN